LSSKRSQEGSIISSETDVGGYPDVEATSAAFVAEGWDLDTMGSAAGGDSGQRAAAILPVTETPSKG
jgi:hypothetical protein